MPQSGDLLRRYLAESSEAAFAEFVRSHLNLVYFTALRRTGNSHIAEEVAQSVFTLAARSAHRLVNHPQLTAWLYTTTRNLAEKARRSEERRRHREHQIPFMQENSSASAHVDWDQVRPHIDQALDQLNPSDRQAVLLRYFENRPYSEIGSLLGSSADAARMRVERALNKLHLILGRYGFKSTHAALALALANQASLAAPAILVSKISTAAVSSTALATGTILGGSLLTFMTTTKTLTLLTAATLVTALSVTGYLRERHRNDQIAATVSSLTTDRDYLESQLEELTHLMTESRKRETRASQKPSPSPKEVVVPSPTNPVILAEPPPVPGVSTKPPPGWMKNGTQTGKYTVGVDQNQTFGGMPSAYASATTSSPNDFGGMMQTISSQSYAGQRVRLSGWMKTEDITRSGNLWLRVDGENKPGLSFDNMSDRSPKGTTDWQEYSIVLDVPAESKSMSYGFFLGGNGKLWVSGTKIETVGAEIPLTRKPPPKIVQPSRPPLATQPVNLGFGTR